MPKPLVTVYIPTRNRLSLVLRAAESVVRQTYERTELIIVDDASVPHVRDALREFKKHHSGKVEVLFNDVNVGAPTSRNRAIRAARGEFTTGLDDDDWFLPNRIEAFLSEWRNNDAFLYADDIFLNGTLRSRIRKKNRADKALLLAYNAVGNQIFTRTDRLISVGGFDEALSSAQDYELWVRLVEQFGAGRRVPAATQVVTRGENFTRISASRNAWTGYFVVYKRHKSELNRSSRKSRLFAILQARGRHLRVKFLIALITKSNALNILKYWLLHNRGARMQ